ncbi:MAG TPA: preprotein translocase subunit SecG [Elusimicrobia bacterium]|nr:preprotein translocase subunit SecG [Elusimicrobiota bacterium]HBT61198.1 preprotein translocase subunit SecG [Elusimicrobiota bacterium]
MIYTFLEFVHIIACLLMILVVLLQSGRGAGLAIFGGGGDSLINTPSGSDFMKKFTAALAGTFAFTSLFLTLLASRAGMTSVTSRVRVPVPAPAEAPAPVGK